MKIKSQMNKVKFCRDMTESPQTQINDAAAVKDLLSCQPRVTVTSCFVYTVIRDLETIDQSIDSR